LDQQDKSRISAQKNTFALDPVWGSLKTAVRVRPPKTTTGRPTIKKSIEKYLEGEPRLPFVLSGAWYFCFVWLGSPCSGQTLPPLAPTGLEVSLGEILCLPASLFRGSGFSLAGKAAYADADSVNVLASSRLKPVPRDRAHHAMNDYPVTFSLIDTPAATGLR
jgi:hypothetical protein